jgi:predicted ferric reductase
VFNRFRPGQYVFTTLVGRNLIQYANWHPFTISESFRVNEDDDLDTEIEERIAGSEINEKSIKENAVPASVDGIRQLRHRANMVNGKHSTIASIHIKTLGRATNQVFETFKANEKVKVYVDGPYGPKLSYQDYEVLALFATGIGATPGLAIIKDIIDKRSDGVKTVNTNCIYFVWSIKTIGNTTYYSSYLVEY